jgi:hypothetical protein
MVTPAVKRASALGDAVLFEVRREHLEASIRITLHLAAHGTCSPRHHACIVGQVTC